MVDKTLLLVNVGGVLSDVQKLSDGNEHTLHFKAKSSAEVAAFWGFVRRSKDESETSDLARERRSAEFIASSLCDEVGVLVFSGADEAMAVPPTLKVELVNMIIAGSNKPAGSGKVLPPRETLGSGTS